MRVIIAGAGDVGRRLLQDLSETGGHDIVVVDTDEAVVEELADQFDALVIHGDASVPDTLDKAQVQEADALVAATGSDPINTVIAMLGHRLEVETLVVKLTTNALRGALEEIGVTDIVAPTMAAASRIEAALHGTRETELSQLIQGKLQLAELRVGPGAAGRQVDDLDIPEDAMLIGIVHDEQASLPRPDTTLEEGDVLMAVAETEAALERCRELLGQA